MLLSNRNSSSIAFGLWLLLSLGAILLPSSNAAWSYFSSSSSNEDDNKNKNNDDDDTMKKLLDEDHASDLVSPLVNREIQVSVKAPWPSSPYNLFCEAWTFTDGDWTMLDRLIEKMTKTAEEENGDDDKTDEDDFLDSYKDTTEFIMTNLFDGDNPSSRLLRFALTMRSQSPTCELHRVLAQQEWIKLGTLKSTIATNAFAVINGNFLVDQPEQITQTVASVGALPRDKRTELLLPGEKKFHPNVNTNDIDGDDAPLVVLYANLGTSDFTSWYNHLVASKLPFVVRHLGSPKDETDYTALQGYGVRLDIRNVEYKVFDDRADGDDGEDDAGMVNLTALEDLTPHFLAGVNLTAVGIDEKELQATLWKLQEASEQHSAMIPPAWQRRKLSLQAATVIANSPGNELLALQDISQNLPSVASTLVHVDVPDYIEDDVVEPMGPLQSMIRSSGGGLWINGKPIPIERPSFNVFEMIQQLQKEQAELENLSSNLKPYLKNPGQALRKIQTAWSQGEAFFHTDDDDDEPDNDNANGPNSREKHPRINLEKNEKRAVLYINDVEKDSMYQQWPRQVKQALMGMQYGMPPMVRRNLFTVISVYDPVAEESATNMGKALFQQLAQGQFPARLGVLLVDQKDIDRCSEWVRETKPEDRVPCPFDDSFWSSKTQRSLSELEEIPLSARDIHRAFAFVAKRYKDRKEILMMYEQYIGPSLAQNPPRNGRFHSLADLMLIHGEILVGTQALRNAPSPVDTFGQLMSMDDDSDADYSYGYAVRYAVDKGLKVGMSFVNGRPLPSGDDEDAGERVSSTFMEEQQVIFGMIMSNEITDSSPTSVYRKLLKSKNVFPKVHPLLSSPTDGAYVEIEHNFGPASLLSPTSTESPIDAAAVFGVDAVLEIDTVEGLDLAKKFISIMKSFPTKVSDVPTSIAFRILPSTESASTDSLCPILASSKQLGVDSVLKLIDLKLSGKDVSESEIDGSIVEQAKEAGKGACSSPPISNQDFPSKNFISANGRVYNVEGLPLDIVDIELLLSIEFEQGTIVTEFLKDHLKPDLAHDAVSRTAAFLAAAKGGSQERYSPDASILDLEKSNGIEQNPLRFNWNAVSEGDALKSQVTAIVDPVTETAQRLAPLLHVIRDELKLPLMLVLAPKLILDGDAKIPIASYYRFVSDPNAFQLAAKSPNAHFENLPIAHTLTVRMDVPEPWDIQQAQSVQDTDNLRCSLQSGCSDASISGKPESEVPIHEQRQLTDMTYMLNHLLFFGQCYDSRGSPPNGLQLTLSEYDNLPSGPSSLGTVEVGPDGTLRNEIDTMGDDVAAELYSDTLVMKTVGYWQLRANPGLWDLSIDTNSRGAEIFDLVEGDFKSGMPRVTGVIEGNTKRLIMSDFVTHSKLLMVQRKPGKEKESLFAPIQSSTDSSSDEEDDRVHVFSLATGHLYERFLKIMMLSVTKRTSSKVKFWLFENFLSPTFKASAMAMAEKIGCEVEFRTYKWPEWLRGQTEKQRIIWGYKILFLDVLFPMSVKKIIYVDADQVVRGDLKELWDMDLQGAPYGYTPMCSSRETTLGYQFWNTGFWKSHLQGKPYHISALYVVDLERFRKGLVGDKLRAIYQQLSADPNSLANLDQDLPNYAQHQVPIFSLPQEWLWCESWCSDETKPDAKTIDLCNNPLHKEPKVSMAKRIISGELFHESWVELDAEVETYEKEYFETVGVGVA